MRKVAKILLIGALLAMIGGGCAYGGAYYQDRHLGIGGVITNPNYAPVYSAPIPYQPYGFYQQQWVNQMVCGPYGCWYEPRLRIIRIPGYGY